MMSRKLNLFFTLTHFINIVTRTKTNSNKAINMSSPNFSFDPQMSIYIPRCDTRSLPKRGRTEKYDLYELRVCDFIASKFNVYYGDVTRIDLLGKLSPDNYTYYIAFVHLNWYDTPKAHLLQANILNPDVQAKIHYSDGKWFWHINKNTKPLTAEEAALHKRIYYLERDLLKITGDRNSAYVLLLREAAPNSWQALCSYVSSLNPRDFNDAMRQHVLAFIPFEFLAPLRIQPHVQMTPPPQVLTRTHENGFIAPLAIRRSTTTAPCQPPSSNCNYLDNDNISPPPPKRIKPNWLINMVPTVRQLFDSQCKYEEKCAQQAELRATDLDTYMLPDSGTVCNGCLENQPGHTAHMGPNGCLGENEAWDFDSTTCDENDSMS